MNANDLTACLERKGVRPTANRILVLRLRESAYPMSLADLENHLETLDKSSIFGGADPAPWSTTSFTVSRTGAAS